MRTEIRVIDAYRDSQRVSERGTHGPSRLRTRVRFLALALSTIAVGLVLHWHGTALTATLRDVLGDALWAMMVAWWLGALAPHTRVAVRAAIDLVLCWAVELSQLIRIPVIDDWRQTTVGHLFLGSGFDPRDLAAYAIGVLAALALELAMRRRRTTSTIFDTEAAADRSRYGRE